MTDTKLCRKCSTVKSVSEFGKGKNHNDGLYYWCKSCVKTNNASRRFRPKILVSNQECTTCGLNKLIASFDISISETTGHRQKCKSCRKAAYKKTKDVVNAKNRQKRAENPGEALAKESAWREANIERVLSNRRRYKQENKGKRAAAQRKREADKLQATPAWADLQYIEDLYVNCREAEELFGAVGFEVKFEVDHMVPLRGKTVCGLHVEHNLQILTANENAKKHNTFSGDDCSLTSMGG